MAIIVFMPRPLKVQKRRPVLGMAIPLIARAPTRDAAPNYRQRAAKKFDAAVDIEKPPTVTALAEMGKGERPKGFIEATHVIGTPERFAEFFAANLARHRSAASRRFLAKQ